MFDIALEILVGGLVIAVALFFTIIIGTIIVSQAFRIVEWLESKLHWGLLPWE